MLPEPERVAGKRRYTADVFRRLAIIDAIAEPCIGTKDRRWVEVARELGGDDPRVREVVVRLADLERSLEDVRLASVSGLEGVQRVV